jgi:hypothetical protein
MQVSKLMVDKQQQQQQHQPSDGMEDQDDE